MPFSCCLRGMHGGHSATFNPNALRLPFRLDLSIPFPRHPWCVHGSFPSSLFWVLIGWNTPSSPPHTHPLSPGTSEWVDSIEPPSRSDLTITLDRTMARGTIALLVLALTCLLGVRAEEEAVITLDASNFDTGG